MPDFFHLYLKATLGLREREREKNMCVHVHVKIVTNIINYKLMDLLMKITFQCGCSVVVGTDEYGGIDATDLMLCEFHKGEYKKRKSIDSYG
jgi:hypothetical protein